jgi:hypothetical protein
MGRGDVRCWVLLLALSVAGHAAHANDRRAGVRSVREAVDIAAARAPGAQLGRSSFEVVTATNARAGGKQSLVNDQSERDGTTSRKAITFFRFKSRLFGEVQVQPTLGVAKGAQLSIGF